MSDKGQNTFRAKDRKSWRTWLAKVEKRLQEAIQPLTENQELGLK
jgi:hypothetical protein